MAAEVSSIARLANGYADEAEGKRRDLVTRDLLGGCSTVTRSTKELDLDHQIPIGWERRLDLLSGETYLKKSNSDEEHDPIRRPIHDLNLPPPPIGSDPSSTVDLKLLLSTTAPPPSDYQCTLEKVKSALERATRESRRSLGRSQSRSSSSTSSSAAKRKATGDRDGEEVTDGSDSSLNLMAAGCSKCLMYVLVSFKNPRCPQCDSHVAVQSTVAKKPRIQSAATNPTVDLNLNSRR